MENTYPLIDANRGAPHAELIIEAAEKYLLDTQDMYPKILRSPTYSKDMNALANYGLNKPSNQQLKAELYLKGVPTSKEILLYNGTVQLVSDIFMQAILFAKNVDDDVTVFVEELHYNRIQAMLKSFKSFDVQVEKIPFTNGEIDIFILQQKIQYAPGFPIFYGVLMGSNPTGYTYLESAKEVDKLISQADGFCIWDTAYWFLHGAETLENPFEFLKELGGLNGFILFQFSKVLGAGTGVPSVCLTNKGDPFVDHFMKYYNNVTLTDPDQKAIDWLMRLLTTPEDKQWLYDQIQMAKTLVNTTKEHVHSLCSLYQVTPLVHLEDNKGYFALIPVAKFVNQAYLKELNISISLEETETCNYLRVPFSVDIKTISNLFERLFRNQNNTDYTLQQEIDANTGVNAGG